MAIEMERVRANVERLGAIAHQTSDDEQRAFRRLDSVERATGRTDSELLDMWYRADNRATDAYNVWQDAQRELIVSPGN